jgi:dipeptidyl aminopeptidase/acylaminoacyl peptidase
MQSTQRGERANVLRSAGGFPPMKVGIENYLNIRWAYSPSFSPDGKRVAFLTNITGLPQVWQINLGGGWPDQLTFHTERVLGVWYSPTHNRLVYAMDKGGNENTQLYLMDMQDYVERKLTDDDGAMHIFGAWSPNGKHIAFSANRRNRGRYDIYVQDVESDGQAEVVWENDQPGMVAPVAFSPDGARLLVFFMHSELNHDLYEIELSERKARHLTPHQDQVRYAWPVYSADGKSVYCLCNMNTEFTGVSRLNLSDLRMQVIAQPDMEAELLAATRDGRYLAWEINRNGASEIVLHELSSGRNRTAPGLPMGLVSGPPDETGLVFSPMGTHLCFSFSSATRTQDLLVWNLASDKLHQITKSSHGGIPESSFVQPELIQYPTFDGRLIPAWFYHPLQSDSSSLPVILWVHGGPEAQYRPMFFPIVQYFVRRGYAVLAPNVRGSTGYGKTYVCLDDVEKRMDSVFDLAHAVYWLRKQPKIDSKRIAVYGGSYGGFMVLAALTSYPDLWAAGVEICGISNLVTFLENTGPYRRSVREAEYGSLEQDRKILESISPIHKIEKIQAPLMVIHGANDPRVPLEEAQQIVDALQTRRIPVQFLVYKDEGHGLNKLGNKLDAFPKIADFLDRHLEH